MINRKLKQIALSSALVLLSVAPALAAPLFSEDFSSATHGLLAVADYSEKWSPTSYYWNPDSTGWTFSSGALLAVNAVNGGTGDQALLLNESPSPGSAITVPGTFVVGQSYRLTFDHWGDNRPNSNPYEFDIKLDSTLLGHLSRTYDAPGLGAMASYDFTATQASYSLRFLDVTGGGQASAIIDNISISAIPEPETYAMMLAGLGLMGFIARRRIGRDAA